MEIINYIHKIIFLMACIQYKNLYGIYKIGVIIFFIGMS